MERVWWMHKASLLVYAVEVVDGLAVRAAGPYGPDHLTPEKLRNIDRDSEYWSEEDAAFLNNNPRVVLDGHGCPVDWSA